MSAGDIFTTDADKRIAELEAREICYIQSLRELEAKYQRLREAADRVVFEAEAGDWACMPSIQACKNLAAVLEDKS